MNLQKNLVLVVSGVATVLLAAVALFFLVRFHGRYSRVTGELQTQLQRLDTLRTRDPYPNTRNVEGAEDNHERAVVAFDALMGALSRNQYTAPDMEPAQFPLLLQRVLGGLNDFAATNNVLIPPRFAYGFDRYARQLPNKQHIPRLALQLHGVEAVCRTLFEAQVRELSSVSRFLFEEAEAATEPGMEEDFGMRGRGRSPAPATESTGGLLGPGYVEEEHGLYTAERMLFTVTVGESGVWNVLDAIARMDPFCKVSRLEITGVPPKFQPPRASPEAGGIEAEGRAPSWLDAGYMPPGAGRLGELPPGSVPPGTFTRGGLPPEPLPPDTLPPGTTNLPVRIPSREERVLAGKTELVRLNLELELFHFGPPPAATNEEDAP